MRSHPYNGRTWSFTRDHVLYGEQYVTPAKIFINAWRHYLQSDAMNDDGLCRHLEYQFRRYIGDHRRRRNPKVFLEGDYFYGVGYSPRFLFRI